MNEKLAKVVDALDWDAAAVTPETRLDELTWDSMAMLTVVALARAEGKTVTGDQLRAMVTVGDLLAAL